MALPEPTLWEADPHTLAKHEILKYYLEAWFPILNVLFFYPSYFNYIPCFKFVDVGYHNKLNTHIF